MDKGGFHLPCWYRIISLSQNLENVQLLTTNLPLQERHAELLHLADLHPNIKANAAFVEQTERYHLHPSFCRVWLLF